MGYIKPDDSTMVIYLTHSLIETWASDIVHKRYGATQISPPRRVAFKWVPIDQVKPLKGPGPRIKSNSPALGPIPDFEDYLKFCTISPEDHTTRRLLTQYDIIDFEMFESTELTCAKMEALGFQFGPRIRLHDKVSSYRQELKRRARGNH
ncbi:uncharacterized protein MELLADRAFT_56145 [Melampsora larici-populina 98AG31]|uniref:Uncharacterized protein n=1 Tax=Melampsora larici-populina (strain 98AG31 / pathotype 3-4-7) TaxID=747676 RepID=F4RME0_MELLP|nr:uncharacterized protein MELLADRAFT_56145 [Melampsora larici-populina 98AG31]EGG06490.1 hypothetical protein MELLADRAFT_56145 [Melampsora larici-populina 98AG31]